MNYFKLLKDLYVAKRRVKWSSEKLKTYQNREFRKMLHYAWEHSTYYKTIYQNAGISEKDLDMISISSLPYINKKELLENFDEIITIPEVTQAQLRNFDENNSNLSKRFGKGIHLVHSSGSTGVPGYFLYDEKAWGRMLTGILRGALFDLSTFEIMKLLVKRPRIAYIAATEGRYGGVMAVGDGIIGVGAKQINLDINTPLEQWKKQLEEFKPTILIGYPTAIKILADLVETQQIHIGKIDKIVTCAEPLGRGMREHFQTQFGCKILNFYGASESLAIGVEETSEDGMILFDDMNIIEVEEENMYLTCLYNFAQPLIRYKISDRLIIEKAGNKNKTSFSRAFGLVGRNEDILWFEDENNVKEFLHPLAVEGFCIEGLKDYQFRKCSNSSFEMIAEISKIESQDKINNEITKLMKTILKDKKLDFVNFKVKFVDEIKPDSKTGKKTLILKEE